MLIMKIDAIHTQVVALGTNLMCIHSFTTSTHSWSPGTSKGRHEANKSSLSNYMNTKNFFAHMKFFLVQKQEKSSS